MGTNKKELYRVVTFLKREELDFLDDVAKDIYFDYGIKVPRAKLIEEIIEGITEKSSLDKKSIEEDLVERLKSEE